MSANTYTHVNNNAVESMEQHITTFLLA